MDTGQIWFEGGRGERLHSSLIITEIFADCRVWMRRKVEGALAEGRKIYGTIGGRALFVWTPVRFSSEGSRLSST